MPGRYWVVIVNKTWRIGRKEESVKNMGVGKGRLLLHFEPARTVLNESMIGLEC